MGDPKSPFSIATTPRCRGGCYSFPWIAPLYPWSIPYNAECKARRHLVLFFESLVGLDLGLNPNSLLHENMFKSSLLDEKCVFNFFFIKKPKVQNVKNKKLTENYISIFLKGWQFFFKSLKSQLSVFKFKKFKNIQKLKILLIWHKSSTNKYF